MYLYKNGLSFRECTTLNNSAFNESYWCILRLDSNEKNVVVVVVVVVVVFCV